jgi:23S rRNA (adenine2503-C2)-methyltransferase
MNGVMLYDLTRDEMTELLAKWGEPTYRAKQVWEWLYKKLATHPSQMTNLPAAVRNRLAAETRVEPLERVFEQRSSDQHTIKWVFRLQDGLTIETVLMLYDERRTVCISTQAGCAMGCVFCATGQGGLARNLTPGEIVAQVLASARYLAAAPRPEIVNRHAHDPDGARREVAFVPLSAFGIQSSLDHQSPEFPGEDRPTAPAGQRLTNIVVMGMGEPFANYERVWHALNTITDKDGFGLGARHITVSTVGLPQGIRKMAVEPLQVNLAVSLHAPNDELRGALLPINQRYPIRDVLDAISEYIQRTNRRVTFEYAMMDGINDTPPLAAELAALLKPLRSPTGGVMCHVNLIPLNPVAESPYQPSTDAAAQAFQRALERNGIPATVRLRRGIDIDAGCGQLRRRVAALNETE